MPKEETDFNIDIFISYASSDRVKVLEIAGLLKAAGLSVWLDQQSIQGMMNYGPEIVRAIKSSRIFCIMCSDKSLKSKNVKQEIQIAWKYDRPFLPLLIEQAEFHDQVEYWLEGWQWVEILEHPREKWVPAVFSALNSAGLKCTEPGPEAIAGIVQNRRKKIPAREDSAAIEPANTGEPTHSRRKEDQRYAPEPRLSIQQAGASDKKHKPIILRMGHVRVVLSIGAEIVWRLATQEAVAAGHKYLEKEHLLMAVCSLEKALARPGGIGAKGHWSLAELKKEFLDIKNIFIACGLEFSTVRRSVRGMIGRGNYIPKDGVVHRSNDCKRVFQNAIDLSSQSAELKCLHILAAIADNPGAVISNALAAKGATAEKIKLLSLEKLADSSV